MSDKPDNVVSIRTAVAAAKPVRRRKTSKGAGGDPPEIKRPDGDDPNTWPMKPLGVNGNLRYYLDANGQIQALKPSEHGRLGIIALAGAKNHVLPDLWPRIGRGGIVNGTDYDKAAQALVRATSSKGVWNPFGAVRGAGSWAGEDSELIFHCGDVLRIGDQWRDPGIIGRFVYPTDRPRPRPYERTVGRGDMEALFAILKSWNWKRGALDARLLLGWIGASLIAGAIEWRPVVWVTGGRGTGKSTIHKLLSMLMADSLVAVSDASPAGVWQKLGYATLPVILDEVEAEEDNRRGHGLVKFARQAASGGLVLRGGSDHGASEFTARSCFLFSSILIPPLAPQDRSRMAILELGELGQVQSLNLDARVLRARGEQVLRRLADGWPRWKPTLRAYSAALMQCGHDNRGSDVFGTLLAAADILLSDGEPAVELVHQLAEQLNVESLAEAEDDARDEDECLSFLKTLTIPVDGPGAKRPIAEWFARAVGLLPSESDDGGGPTRATKGEAMQMLGRYGLKIVPEGEHLLVGIASRHAELGKLFGGTRWGGERGGKGVWTNTLRRLQGARPSGKNLWFCGAAGKATLLPLSYVLADPQPGDILPPTDRRLNLGGTW